MIPNCWYVGNTLFTPHCLVVEIGVSIPSHFGIFFSIDATLSDCLGRLVNDGVGQGANAVIKHLRIGHRTVLCLFAKRDIAVGEELRYDYGVSDLPWRTASKTTGSSHQHANTQKSDSQTDNTDLEHISRQTTHNEKDPDVSILAPNVSLHITEGNEQEPLHKSTLTVHSPSGQEGEKEWTN